jgi:hypothetical protein
VEKVKAIYKQWKIPVAALFIGLIYLAVNLQSEHWISFLKGILFFSDLTDLHQLELIKNVCFWVVPILSFLFLIVRNRIANIALILLMILTVLLVFPFGYVDDPTMSF